MTVAPAALAQSVPTTTLTAADEPEDKLSSKVLTQLEDKKTADFWIQFADKADLAPAQGIADWSERGQFVYDALHATAKKSQASVITKLKAADAQYESYWINNAIFVDDGSLELAESLATSSAVSGIHEQITMQNEEPVEKKASGEKSAAAVEWGLDAINAPDVWDLGYTGSGITVANFDTGVDATHPALQSKYRGYNADGTYDNDYNYFDIPDTCGGGAPCDSGQHGTHTMGTIVGGSGANQIGVAPDATWIASNCIDNGGCAWDDYLANAQWFLAPTRADGSDADPSKRPHVVSNSWGIPPGVDLPQDWMSAETQAWNAAGIFGAWAGGNEGPSCESGRFPGEFEHTYSVGAFDVNGAIASFSARGPGRNGTLLPNIAAPGVNVRSSIPGGGYANFSGTSMATPHLAGAIALLWSAAPALVGDIEGTIALLDETAIDTEDLSCGGTPERNNVWGEGKLDVAALVDAAPTAGTGTVTGTVTDAAGAPIAGASVLVDGERDRTVSTGADGTFSATVLSGDFSVSASAFGYIASAPTAVTVDVDETETVSIALESAPRHDVTGTVVFEGTSEPVIGAPVTLRGSPYEPTATGEDGTFAFADVPEGTYSLSVELGGCAASYDGELVVDGAEDVDITIVPNVDDGGYSCSVTTADYRQGSTLLNLTGDDVATSVDLPFEFPLYGEAYSRAYLTSNGHINFLGSTTSYANVAIPATSQPNAALYPFWDDLLLDSASGVYTATTTVDGVDAYVLEWRNVRKYSPATDRLNFSVTLLANGDVTFGYGALTDSTSAKGDSATVGVENAAGTVATQYSFNQAALSEGLSLTFDAPAVASVSGVVKDYNTKEAIEGADVTLTSADGAETTATTGADGSYSALVSLGRYDVTLAADGYETLAKTANVSEEGGAVTVSGQLKAGQLTVSKTAIEASLAIGGSASRNIKITNSGSAPAEVDLSARGGEYVVLGGDTASTSGVLKGVQGKATAAKLPFSSGGTKADGLRAGGSGSVAAGEVAEAVYPDVAADETTLSHSTSHEIVASSSVACPSGVTKLLRTYTPGDFGITAGFQPTSVTFGIQEVATPSTTATVTLYTLSGAFTYANLTPIGSGQVTVTDDFGSWYTVPIDAEATIAPDDILVVEVAGTAIYVGGNPAAETSPTYLASDGCGTPEPTTADSLGFPDSNLVIDVTGEVAGSGGGVEWLDVQPPSFTLAPGKSVTAVATITAAVDQPGTYTASINIGNDTPYDVTPVTATMSVKAPAGWGKITGTVSGGGAAIEDAVVVLDGVSYDVVLRTDAEGTYSYWMQKSNAPLQVTVSADGFVPATKKAQIIAGQTTVYNFGLTAL
ncbi:S8 family serine peptidase [Promicromonospora sukumoe]|uniref:Subtilisin family serine protease n=1 Tax=Promicromonospora sukumoe TaxID=88382 RepID=A0A7W3JDR4_9MICO|nr:carboxypeptidase regulatory-like domain-containing protein [Promicromonospora sukumoe]MBA8810889.1 subtilisin family serine protease [Promicromonospora sukumoe]